MSSLPSAHASQRFGRRQIEFFAVSGHVTDSPERARSSQRSIQDLDGASHTIRVSDRSTRLDEGDSIAVLRLQSGPDRRSRPVSAVNYTADQWTELGRGASATLSRTGISRGGIWWFAILAFILTALAIVWSDLRLFLVEVNSDWFGGAPDFQLLPLLNGLIPALSGFDLAGLVPGFSDAVAATGFLGTEHANAVAVGLVLTLLGLVAFAARTWRIVWVPVFILAALCAGLILAPDQPADISLIALGVGALFFVIAGFFNRVRDAARLKARIERLSEHLLRHPPVESVSVPVTTPTEETAPAAEAAASEAETQTEAPEGEPVDDADVTDTSTSDGETRSDARVAASATAMAAVAAAVMSDNDGSADDTRADDETPGDDDDLPSDAELAAAQNEPATDESTTAESGTDDVPVATAPDASSETIQDAPPHDRDMILPAPPPMATPEDNNTEAGDAAPQETDPVDDQETAPSRTPAADSQNTISESPPNDSGESPVETSEAKPSIEPEGSASETVDAEVAEVETTVSDMSGDALDLSGDDPMMSDVEETGSESDLTEAEADPDTSDAENSDDSPAPHSNSDEIPRQ